MSEPAMRIKCRHYETDEGDGVTNFGGWHDVTKVQSLDDSQATEPKFQNMMTFSLLDWNTHEGLCPACAKEEAARLLEFDHFDI